jgi:hypothetical protein
MPLYWYTDKPIGKYRLKKPIPIRGVDADGNEYTFLLCYLADSSFEYGAYTTDDEAIEYIEKYSDDFKEYLEEI